MRIARRVLVGLTMAGTLGLGGCGDTPASISECTIERSVNGALLAKVKLQNRSSKTIVKSKVLIEARSVDHRGGNRLFESKAQVPPLTTRAIEEISHDDRNSWTFKDYLDNMSGCELDSVFYEDGTHWELGVPFI